MHPLERVLNRYLKQLHEPWYQALTWVALLVCWNWKGATGGWYLPFGFSFLTSALHLSRTAVYLFQLTLSVFQSNPTFHWSVQMLAVITSDDASCRIWALTFPLMRKKVKRILKFSLFFLKEVLSGFEIVTNSKNY